MGCCGATNLIHHCETCTLQSWMGVGNCLWDSTCVFSNPCLLHVSLICPSTNAIEKLSMVVCFPYTRDFSHGLEIYEANVFRIFWSAARESIR
jgi:hypothetical protein